MSALQKYVREVNLKNLANVPKHLPASIQDVENLFNFINCSNSMLVLTGAGISTESGIPDYRSEGVGLYSRQANYKPIQQGEFVRNEPARKRYWLKNYIGWPLFSQKSPNATHYSVAKLEEAGKLTCIVTQNVDSLHFKAGSKRVVELHGSAHRVVCLQCKNLILRKDFQEVLSNINPHHKIENFILNPDGDVDIKEDIMNDFVVPACADCGGLLQPDIVFFGGSVPLETINLVNKQVEDCDSVVVMGSSLTVFSSYRIILKAIEAHKPIAIINIGKTRGDPHASMKIEARCGEIVPEVCEKLLSQEN